MQPGNSAILEPRLVGDLEGVFFVPDYQRGYRWGEEEVTKLLDDILEAGTTKYYLQPVVVKALKDGRWELVDGQQRLTTLYLLLRSIKRYFPESKPKYSMTYETREGSAAYLDDPRQGVADQNIDFFHMYAAYRTIQAWFERQHNATLAAINLYQALTTTVYVIWYQAPDADDFDSRALFTRLNVGRIALTDAELVKASLLSRIGRPEETAAQWDSFERDLWSPEVWAFATATAKGGATRIELLLDTLADADSGGQKLPRPAFATFETLRKSIVTDPKKLWNRVVDLHSLVLGWYDDRNLFHKIGYLIASKRTTFFELVALAQGVPKSSFEKALDELITKSLDLSWSGVAALTYGNAKVNNVLLLMNVETVRGNEHSSERYSFSAHAGRIWSLEHIHAQHSEGMKTVEQWTSWLKEHSAALDVLEMAGAVRDELRARIDAALPTISKETFEVLFHELFALFSPPAPADQAGQPQAADRQEMDSISNLALLSRDDNSLLNNDVFEVKRRNIIALDREGSYIPICTRNVFLKYYSTGASAQQIHRWVPDDREAYLKAMKSILEPYLLPDTPENDKIDPADLVVSLA